MSLIQEKIKSHPDWSAVQTIYHRLSSHGYRAFLAGGCVRDALLGVQAHDLDVATDATPENIEALFEKTVNVGKAFGVMRVLVDGADIEVATFRTDGPYKDGRRPEGVLFSSPQEDAQRRDFTVNALFYDLESAQVIDFVQGLEDLKKGVLRTVGVPEQRFTEDHLRLLRAARFVAQLNFVLEERSFSAMKAMASFVKTVSGERIRDEMSKLLKTASAAKGLQVMVDSGLMEQLFAFRQQDSSWKGDLGAQDAWQRWSLFLRQASADNLKTTLDALKMSAKDYRAIEKSWALWQKPEDFFAQNRGKKLQQMPKEGVEWALEVLVQEKSIWANQAQELMQDWAGWCKRLPSPFLTGDDLQGKLQGKAIGDCLSLAFEAQLERKLQSRSDALVWLGKYLESKTNG